MTLGWLCAVLNKSWKQHPKKLQLHFHLPPILQTIQEKQAKYAGHCWVSKDELISNILLWMATHTETPVLSDRKKLNSSILCRY